jgi:hypothetical protein
MSQPNLTDVYRSLAERCGSFFVDGCFQESWVAVNSAYAAHEVASLRAALDKFATHVTTHDPLNRG